MDSYKKKHEQEEYDATIPFGAMDSELHECTYYIPKGMEAFIDGDKIVIKRKASEDEKIRYSIVSLIKFGLEDGSAVAPGQSTTKEEALAWLEKQGEQKPSETIVETWKNMRLEVYQQASGNRHEPNYSDDNTKMFSLNDIDEIIEKMNEQKPVNKAEPKFHIGDWVIDKQGIVHQIANVVENVTNHAYGYDIVGGGYFNDNTEGVRLWTIQDAKDGDVLFQDLMGGKTFIFDGVNPDMAILYSFIISNDGEDVLPYHIGKPNTGIGNIEENRNIIHPATKEQRDLLSSKMEEYGYEWDDDKKELRKIEQKPVEPNEWSEEDEQNLNSVINVWNRLRRGGDAQASPNLMESLENWLKSIKERLNN